jgi:hypothetical protein
MKYLEELSCGETFVSDNNYWFLTCDFSSQGKRLCYNMNSGYAKWLKPDIMVEICPIYTLDKDNNIIPIKIYSKNENSNIS